VHERGGVLGWLWEGRCTALSIWRVTIVTKRWVFISLHSIPLHIPIPFRFPTPVSTPYLIVNQDLLHVTCSTSPATPALREFPDEAARRRTSRLSFKNSHWSYCTRSATPTNTMNSLKVARMALRAAARPQPALRRGYADVAPDKLRLSLALPHQVCVQPWIQEEEEERGRVGGGCCGIRGVVRSNVC